MATDLTKKREEECIPIAREILRLIGEASAEAPMGAFDQTAGDSFYQKFLEEKILPLLTEKDIKTAEATYIMSMVLQPLDFTKNLLNVSLQDAENSAVAAKFGVPDIRDIRISHIVEAQKQKASAAVDKPIA